MKKDNKPPDKIESELIYYRRMCNALVNAYVRLEGTAVEKNGCYYIRIGKPALNEVLSLIEKHKKRESERIDGRRKKASPGL